MRTLQDIPFYRLILWKALKLLQNHPHLAWTDGCVIEVHESLAVLECEERYCHYHWRVCSQQHGGLAHLFSLIRKSTKPSRLPTQSLDGDQNLLQPFRVTFSSASSE